MTKLNWGLIILALGILIELFVGWNANTAATIVVFAGILIGILTILRITINGVNNEKKGQIILATAVLGILVLFGVSVSSMVSTDSVQPGTTYSWPTAPTPTTVPGSSEQSATLNLYVNSINGSYLPTNAGTIYALKPGQVTDRNDFMKKMYDGNTANLVSGMMSISSAATDGKYVKSGYNAKIGDTVVFAGYQDTSPAAQDNVSFIKTATITGITAGSTPEWQLSDSQFTWYRYPTLLYYDSSDAAKTKYTEVEASAIDKVFTLYMHPTHNGERWTDAALWIECPESSVANIDDVQIDGVSFGMPQEITSTDPRFRAQPSLFVSTDKMYYAGTFKDVLRSSTSSPGTQEIVIKYNHPASSNVSNYLWVTQNTNALGSSGGHYDSPATHFFFGMNATGVDAWT